MILLTTLCWFAIFRVVGFLELLTVEPKTTYTAEQFFKIVFSVDIRNFLWSSIF